MVEESGIMMKKKPLYTMLTQRLGPGCRITNNYLYLI